MSRNGSGVYSLPGTYEAVAGETILAEQHNDPLEDLEQDMNTVRPIVAGGTGADTAVEAMDALFVAAANIASAATVNLAASTGHYVNITGTTTITAFGTLAAGNFRFLKFAGALTLTYNATSLILSGGADVITVAGNIALAVSEGGGNWRVTFIRGTAALARGVDLASAATLNLDSVQAPILNVTGTTTVTAVTLTSGHWRIVRATGAFQMTAGASLIVNGSTTVNYTTVAGDLLLFEGYGSSVVRVWVIGYGGSPTLIQPTLTLKQGTGPTPTAEGDIQWDTDDDAIVVGDGSSQKIFRANAWELIERGTATSVATKDFTGLSAYRMLRLTAKVEPATDGVVPWLRTSTDNGSTFAASANDYHIQNVLISNATTTSSAVTNAAQLHLVANNIVGNSSTEGASLIATIFDWNQSRYAHFITETFFLDTGGAVNRSINAGQRAQATARDALRFMFSSGNISNMHYVLEGVRG